ncbi:hypothetical protein SteCoe_28427 [Stentor coeruleus]|uniref:EGF-like domain-containing protein n=1 Tax=Stentor coeruleus TaxID=5963 RepID=A0A1R2B8T6_9CILI|nr:hypothetical protein SteCoe_28427 [Stentor coeruleus]
MDKVLRILVLCVIHCYGSILIDYRLGKNFGQKIIDYSGNGMHAVNGDNSTIDSYDTIPTDRGAYFPLGKVSNYDYHILMMPNEYNNNQTYIFPEKFSMSTWVMLLIVEKSVIFHRKTNLKLKFHDNFSPLLKIVLSSGTSVILGGDKTFLLGIIYIEIWVYLVVTIEPNKVTLYTNGEISNYYEGNFTFIDQTTSPKTYIGGINGGPSMNGYMWSFILYSDIIIQSDFVELDYPIGDCLVDTCPKECNGIKENGLTYCISEEIDWFKNGANISCPINCDYGCLGSLCLDCKCNEKSCIIENNEVICWCPENCVSNSTDCVCEDGFYRSDDLCLSCNSECKTCDEADKCLTCIANNSKPKSNIGCECLDGYYGSNLINEDSCLACFEECEICSDADICDTCIALNSYPDDNQGCICNDGYYGSMLISNDSCSACFEECKTCSSADICDTCIALNAFPNVTKGCFCNDGYYGSTLTSNDSCSSCFEECKTCSSTDICDTCIALNAFPNATKGCFCNDGYYGNTLTSNDSCLTCFDECKTCSEADICDTCIALNAFPNVTKGCFCNDGYYGNTLTSNDSCSVCFNECKTCSSADICDTCIALNSYPDDIQGCICNDGYYRDTLISNDSCITCFEECLTCSQTDICETCITFNASPNNIQGCSCDNGYYGSKLTSNDSCKSCFNECKTCSSADICDTCISLNASPNTTGGCFCNNGYYGNNLISNESCLICNEECLTCSQGDICDTCIVLNSSPNNNTQGCSCDSGYYKNEFIFPYLCLPCNDNCIVCNENSCLACKDQNSEPFGMLCKCKDGYYSNYNSSNSTDLVCDACNETCKSCLSVDECLECYYNYTNLVDGKCICPDYSDFDGNECLCQSGYFMEKSTDGIFRCKACHSSCKECNNEMEDGCIECKNDVILNNNYCNSCKVSMFYEKSSCYNCITLCTSCNSSSTCDICESNSELLHNNTCKCKKGFKYQSNHCIGDYFSANLKINSLNKLLLTFTENPENPLTDYNYSIIIPNIISTTYIYTKISNNSILITPIFIEYIKTDTILELIIETNIIYSENNKQLDIYTYNCSLYEYIPFIINPLTKEIVQRTEAATQVTVNSAIFCAILSNPATAWMLINTIQLIQYFILSKNPLTPGIRGFLKALGGFNIIPNLSELIFSKNATSSPYDQALESGIETSMFWINTWPFFVFLFVGILVVPVLFMIRRLNMLGLNKKASKILKNYRYSFFIRFWIQSYLDIGIAAFIQLHSSVNKPYQGYFNLLSAAFFAVFSNQILFVLTLPLLFVGCCLNKPEIIERKREFMSRWGCLYEELKKINSFWGSQFYLFFFIRRFIYVIAQVYLNNFLYFQGSLNICFSFLFLMYLTCYRSFTSKLVLFSYFISELATLLFFSLSFTFLFDISDTAKNIIEIIIIGNIVLCLFIQFFICVIQLAMGLNIKWKIYEKKIALKFVQNAVQVKRGHNLEFTSA